jgi:hypothetical protein
MHLPACEIRVRSYYAPQPGDFGVETPHQANWYTCREVFHARIVDSPNNPFYIFTNNPESVAGLIQTVENILGVEKCGFAVHRSYYNSNALEIRPSRFWTMQPMRHQFLSCVTRAGLDYDYIKNPLQALQDYKYFNESWPATERFLRGYTWYTGDVIGWHRAFSKFDYDAPVHLVAGGPVYNENKVVELDTLIRPDDHHVRNHAQTLWQEWNRPQDRDSDIWHQSQKDCGTVRV